MGNPRVERVVHADGHGRPDREHAYRKALERIYNRVNHDRLCSPLDNDPRKSAKKAARREARHAGAAPRDRPDAL